MEVFALTLVGLLLVIGLIGVRIILVPNGQFRGTCSTNSEFLRQKGVACPVCGKGADEICTNQESPIDELAISATK